MTAADIGRLVTIDELRLSRDGSHVAYVVSRVDLEGNTYRSTVWVARLDRVNPPWQLTADGSLARSPRWSPDGQRLAYVREKLDEPRCAEIVVASLDAPASARSVVTWHEEVDALEWSPDGSQLAFGARTPDPGRANRRPRDQPPRRITQLFQRLEPVGWLQGRHRQLHLVPSDGSSAPVTLTRTGSQDGAGASDADTRGLSWFPDGSAVAFVTARHRRWDIDRLDDIWLARTRTPDAEPTKLTKTEFSWSWPAVGPDGDRIAAIWHGPPHEVRHGRLAVLSVATLDWEVLADDVLVAGHAHPSARPMFPAPSGPVWAGDDVLYMVETRGNQHVFRVRADGSTPPEPVVTGDRWVHAFDAAGDVVACVVSTPAAPPEVVVVEGTGEERVLTDLGGSLTSEVELSAPVRFVARSTGDAEVEAWYIPPVGREGGAAAPALVNIHGGPFSQYGNRFFDEFQLQAGAGYGVIYCNPRGSSGYGDGWGQAVAWPNHPAHPGSGWGGVDAEDVLAVVDEACRRFPSIDPDRIGLLGGSYGGYLTSWLVTQTDRFAAACSERAVNDVVALEQSSDIASAFRNYTGRPFFEQPEGLLERSPISHAPRIRTPLLILHSEGDLRCPIHQAEALFTALRLLERDVEMVRFPEEGHDLSRTGAPVHRVQRAEIILEWFDRWLGHASP